MGQREFYLFGVCSHSLKDTMSKLHTKEVFIFLSAAFLRPSAATCSVKNKEAKKKWKRKETLKKLDGFWSKF